MIGYPRWKIALVAIVMVIGIFVALPNLFGEESALQLARDRAVVTPSDRSDLATFRAQLEAQAVELRQDRQQVQALAQSLLDNPKALWK